MTASVLQHSTAITIAVGVAAGLASLALAVATSLCIAFVCVFATVRFGWPLWVAEVLIWSGWGLAALGAAVICMFPAGDADLFGVIIWGSLSGLCFYHAYEVWSRNRPRKKRSPRANGRVSVVDGMLKVMPR